MRTDAREYRFSDNTTRDNSTSPRSSRKDVPCETLECVTTAFGADRRGSHTTSDTAILTSNPHWMIWGGVKPE